MGEWDNDHLQFARLLAALHKTNAIDERIAISLKKETGLSTAEIRELLDRADAAWDDLQRRL